MLSEKPWKLEQVILLLAGILVCFSFISLTGAVVLHLYGQEKPDLSSLPAIIVGTMSIQGSILFGTGLVVWWYRLNWKEAFGFSTRNAPYAILLGWLAAVAFVPISYLLQFDSFELLTRLHFKTPEQQAVLTLQNAQSWDSRIYFIAFTVLVAPLAEELLFRGVLYPVIKQSGFPRIAWWSTALLFGAIHLNLVNFFPLVVLGLALVWLYEITNNLLASITAHAVFNAINVTVLYFGGDISHFFNHWLRHQ